MSKEIPYQLSVNQLKDALDHVMRLAKASRSQTKRLQVIAARAEIALNGEVYDNTNLKLPEPARSPMSYETEIRVTKRELESALAELADMRNIWLSIDDCEQGSHEQDVLISQMFTLIRDSHNGVSNCLARRDLLKKAEALEDFADSLPKFQSMGAGTAMKLKARELRRQAEGAQREGDAVA